jgi:Flp pilus assembly protein TadB
MFDARTSNVSLEIKRRHREIYKRFLYFLVPFALTTLGAWAHAPRSLLIATFVATWVGLVVWIVNYYRLCRCPACNELLRQLFQRPPLYERCPYCHTPFKESVTDA